LKKLLKISKINQKWKKCKKLENGIFQQKKKILSNFLKMPFF